MRILNFVLNMVFGLVLLWLGATGTEFYVKALGSSSRGPRMATWIGRVLCLLGGLFFLFGAVMTWTRH